MAIGPLRFGIGWLWLCEIYTRVLDFAPAPGPKSVVVSVSSHVPSTRAYFAFTKWMAPPQIELWSSSSFSESASLGAGRSGVDVAACWLWVTRNGQDQAAKYHALHLSRGVGTGGPGATPIRWHGCGCICTSEFPCEHIAQRGWDRKVMRLAFETRTKFRQVVGDNILAGW